MKWVVHCKKESYDVYIGRPGPWGNPYSHLPSTEAKYLVPSREIAIAKYRQMLHANPELLAKVSELRGKVLGCWCKPKACHGDVLAEIANKEESFFD